MLKLTEIANYLKYPDFKFLTKINILSDNPYNDVQDFDYIPNNVSIQKMSNNSLHGTKYLFLNENLQNNIYLFKDLYLGSDYRYTHIDYFCDNKEGKRMIGRDIDKISIVYSTFDYIVNLSPECDIFKTKGNHNFSAKIWISDSSDFPTKDIPPDFIRTGSYYTFPFMNDPKNSCTFFRYDAQKGLVQNTLNENQCGLFYPYDPSMSTLPAYISCRRYNGNLHSIERIIFYNNSSNPMSPSMSSAEVSQCQFINDSVCYFRGQKMVTGQCAYDDRTQKTYVCLWNEDTNKLELNGQNSDCYYSSFYISGYKPAFKSPRK